MNNGIQEQKVVAKEGYFLETTPIFLTVEIFAILSFSLFTIRWYGYSLRFAALSVVLLALFCVRRVNSQEPWPKIQSSKIHKNYP